VLLPISKYRELLEDLSDLAAIAERKDEPAEALDDVRKRLQEKWQSTE
jgi:DNA-binding transcriptional MerR regulator